MIPIKNMEAGDGEYLIQHGKLEVIVNGSPKRFPSVQIFKRMPDGTYTFYRDEVTDSMPID